ncbi:MAG: hypothetical protein NVSMB26_27170 [Beijerinckiaceae bacterium]
MAAAGEEAARTAAADAERATLGALEEHGDDKRDDHHEVDDDKNGLHELVREAGGTPPADMVGVVLHHGRQRGKPSVGANLRVC